MPCHSNVYSAVLVVLVCLIIPGLLASQTLDKRRPRIDCAKYVFAPICRGVAAKRNYDTSSDRQDIILEPENLDALILKSFLYTVRSQDPVRNLRPSESLKQLLQALEAQDGHPPRSYRIQEQTDEGKMFLPALLMDRDSRLGQGL